MTTTGKFFPTRPADKPTIYAFASTHPDHVGLLKVGYTEREASERIAEQWPGGLKAYRIENEFFRADGEGKNAKFEHESEVQKCLVWVCLTVA